MTDAEKFRLSLLTPSTRARAEDVIQRMVGRGFREPYVGQTLRTYDEQQEAVKRGTTGRKQKLTWHFKFKDGARAVDFRDRLPNGQPDPTTRNEVFFLALWKESTACGLRCLGYVRDANGYPVKYYINGGRVWDAGHCEFREPYGSLVEAIRAEAPHLLDHETPTHDPDDVPEPAPDDTQKVMLSGLPPSPFK